MDFALSDEQSAIFEMARDFGAARIAPHARDWERAGDHPQGIVARGRGAWLWRAVRLPRRRAARGSSRLDATLVFEALSMACPAVAAFLSIHNMCAGMIDRFGSAAIKARAGCPTRWR